MSTELALPTFQAAVTPRAVDNIVRKAHAGVGTFQSGALGYAILAGAGLVVRKKKTRHDGDWGTVRDGLVGGPMTASEYMRIALGFLRDLVKIRAAGTIEKALEVVRMMELPSHDELLAAVMEASPEPGQIETAQEVRDREARRREMERD
jgi:hypothetical protein